LILKMFRETANFYWNRYWVTNCIKRKRKGTVVPKKAPHLTFSGNFFVEKTLNEGALGEGKKTYRDMSAGGGLHKTLTCVCHLNI